MPTMLYFIVLESTFAETGDGSPTHVSFGCFRRTRGRRICRDVRMVLTHIHTQLFTVGNTRQELWGISQFTNPTLVSIEVILIPTNTTKNCLLSYKGGWATGVKYLIESKHYSN